MNQLFWKHFKLWEQTYGEHYEASLPSGVSESHKQDFIIQSAKKFVALLERLAAAGELPKTIYILEQGPGTGIYAQAFLDYVRDYSRDTNQSFYERTRYLLFDTSDEILAASVAQLTSHQTHIQTITELGEYAGKVLFVRHSNLWDQLPAKIFSSTHDELNELQVQPILDQKLENELKILGIALTINDVAKALKNRTIESLILQQPKIWKPLSRALYLQTAYRTVDEKNLAAYGGVLQQLAKLHQGQEFVFNSEVLANTEQLVQLVDWQHGGYIEVLDVIIPDTVGFDKNRRPKKFDGSLGLPINGPMLQMFLRQSNKHVTFEKVKGINHIVTIREPSLRNLLRNGYFITVAEIAVSKKQTKEEILKSTRILFEEDIDIIAFSDQALVKAEYFKLAELVDLNLFQHLPAGRVMPVLKARTKTENEVKSLTKSLQNQNIKNVFVVTGDPSGDANDTQQTSLDVLPRIAPHFFSGAVAHPQADDIPKMLAKIKAGTQFFIMQATYDYDEWHKWLVVIKKHKIHEKIPIIAVVMPVVSATMLKVVRDIQDVSVPESFINEFKGLSENEIRIKGMELAKAAIDEYKKAGVFSGIYIYSKSTKLIIELNHFIRCNER